MINIYIGENGSGKSQLLGKLAKERMDSKYKVLAIATANNDKFPRQNPKKDYHYMGVRLGRFVAVEAIKGAFAKAYRRHDRFLSTLFNILEYVGYERKIGIRVNQFVGNPVEILAEFKINLGKSDKLNKSWTEEKAINWVADLTYLQQHFNHITESVIWANGDFFSGPLESETVVSLLNNEKLFKKAKIFKSLEIVVSKEGRVFELNDASSGELSLISTAAFIASRLQDKVDLISILIDEPENSLHPKWQQNYVANLMNLFPYYKIDFHIATHSALIVEGAVGESRVNVLRYDGDTFKKISSKSRSIEDALIDQFDIVTPQNSALSDRCIDLINQVDDGEITEANALETINDYKRASNDKRQKDFLDGVFGIIKGLNNAEA